jgi:hypothetical protein
MMMTVFGVVQFFGGLLAGKQNLQNHDAYSVRLFLKYVRCHYLAVETYS